MASKQLGKLRQWAGEVISRDKTAVSDEFRELEEDIDLRRHGVKRLLAASNAYHHVLSKKRDCSPFLDDSAEYLPVDALGMVMILHGEEFSDDSAFGSSLVKFGRAHCKIATLQEAYAVALRNTLMSSMEKLVDEMKDCKLQRKKLESRRLSYDAAISKAEKLKTAKKEKDRKDAEEELQQARLRYEEMAEEVRSRMRAIQDNEIAQLRELTAFLDLELHFVSQYTDVLQSIKTEWPHESVVNKVELLRGDGSLHRPTHSRTEENSPKGYAADKDLSSEEDEDEDESRSRTTSSGRSSLNRYKSGSTSKDSSGPPSRASRKRSESASTPGSGADKEKEKEKSEKSSRRLTVAGWASSAVGSVTKRSKDTFAALTGGGGSERLSDSEGEERITRSFSSSYLKKSSKSRSKDSVATASPKISGKILKPPALQDRKLVVATHDFNGSSEELSFKTGDKIVVLNEVLDEWWMGELDGRRGLFPTVYTEVILTNSGERTEATAFKTDGSTSSSEESGSSDIEDQQHLFIAHHLDPARSHYTGHPDTVSITSSVVEEEEHDKLIPTAKSVLPPLVRTSSGNPLLTTKKMMSADNVVRKTPPPPPPPRRPATNGPVNSPPLPDRRPSAFRSKSSPVTAPLPISTSSPSTSSHEYETSPFESASEITGTGCQDFRQNPFQPPGMCSNCFSLHT